ncbi:hybrid sensor histidine kinase/response regulator [Magnetococcales bacterium HHB-1]
MTDETDENDELLGMFVQEAVEHLETIEPDLLTLEEDGSDTDPEIINRLFRSVHSIKGSAGFFGLSNITRLSHIMENLLGKVREHAIVPTSTVTDSLLSGLDKLKTMIDDVSKSENIDASEQITTIENILNGNEDGGTPAEPASAPPASAPPASAPPAEATVAEAAPATQEVAEPAPVPAVVPSGSDAGFDLTRYPEAVSDSVSCGRILYSIALDLSGDDGDKKSFVSKTRSLLDSVGELVDTLPDTQKCEKLDGLPDGRFEMLLSTVLEPDLLQSLVQLPEDQIVRVDVPADLVERLNAPASTPEATAEPVAAAPVVAAPAAPVPVAPAPVQETPMEVSDPGDEPVEAGRRLVRPSDQNRKVANGKKGGAKAGRGANAKTAPTVEETLRVSVSLLDELINNAGELVLARNQLARASSEVATQFPHISPLVQNLDSITSRIQEKVMQARMQPVSVVFNKFPRIIRDLARKLKKKIDLEIRGGDVDLDKSVIEHLSDPLTHMVRNVADHAIEPPQDRISLGKPESGQVELAAYHENGMVNISLSDDGAGIDADRIKMKALEKGQITERQADNMSEEDALGLIFAPGLSMAKKVSDVSGRGVGMDVVRTNIEKLGGTVQIESKIGKGTRIILKLPLTLAIIPAMIVSAGEQRFAIPEIGLVEIVRVTESDRTNQFETVGNAPVLRLRNMLLPLVDLATVLDIQRVWPPGSSEPERRTRLTDRRASQQQIDPGENYGGPDQREDQGERRDPAGLVAYVMVLNVGGNEFGMVVDEVLDSEEIVVKPLPSFFKDNICFSATTILGDGTVALIIDYAGIMEQANINFSNTEKATRMDLDAERRAALRERQNIILLETESGLLMGIVHSMVRRVEKISPDLLENIGGLPYVRYDSKTFRAIYPDQVLGLEGMGFGGGGGESEDGDLCMVVPNIPDIKAGLIFSRIIDTRETLIDLDCQAIRAEGLFGSAQIDDRVVLFPDVNAVFDMAGISSDLGVVPHIDASGLRALVVDDTPFLRALTTSYLSGIGFEIQEAEDGMMALEYLKDDSYDLLVSDIKMPIMDGFELATEVSSTVNHDIPMIAITSSISSDLKQRCLKAGFTDCISAMDKSRLLEVVTSLDSGGF